jgi:DNA-binding MarR family transcriptional regulator
MMKSNGEKVTPAKVLAEECIAVRLRLINRVVTGIYDEAFRPYGLRVSQMNILGVIALLGRASPAQVCQILHLEKSTFSRNAGRMQSKGWLEAVPEETGRAHRLTVTKEGNEILGKAFPAWREAQRKAISLMGEEGVTVVSRIAQTLFSKGTEERRR